jgi:hypothetical protein
LLVGPVAGCCWLLLLLLLLLLMLLLVLSFVVFFAAVIAADSQLLLLPTKFLPLLNTFNISFRRATSILPFAHARSPSTFVPTIANGYTAVPVG